MNESSKDLNGDMKASWLGWAWVLPQVILGFLNWHAWILARGDMTPCQQSRTVTLGLFEAALLASGCLALAIQSVRKKPIGLGLALAALAAHIGYLWLFLQSLDRLLPATVSLWMLPQTELIFYQFSLVMPVVFLMLVRLSRIRLGLSTPVDVGLSLGVIVVIPSSAFILGSLLVRIERAISWRDGMQYILISSMVVGTAFILVAFLRLMIRLYDLIQSHSWSTWVIPLAAGLVAPLSGLALNATIPFPYDFQDWSVYALTILNAAALMIPFQPGNRWALPGWIARAAFYPFTVYFFLVFLPFLPLSLLAMIAAGAGFLILAPLLLFVVHTRRLWEQGQALVAHHGNTRTVMAFAVCILILPTVFMVRNEVDRRTLNHAVDTVFSPDYHATRIKLRPVSLQRALDRMDDMKHGIYLPYLSDIYDTMVFHGMVLPDEKANLIRQSLLGTTRAEKSRAGMWEGGFFGARQRGVRRIRGGNVSHQVVVASHEEEIRQTNGVFDVEVRFVLENNGGANGEFSERITVPEGVQVTGFWLDVNGTNKTAQLRERKAATWVYEMIRDMTRRDPGLVVYEDDQHLRLRVYPFAAGEKRLCGLRFRTAAGLQSTISMADTLIHLDGGTKVAAVSATLAGGEEALIVPRTTLTNLPSFRREVMAHLILDHSSSAETNHAAVISRARADALHAIENHVPSIPFRGGFCPEQVITRVLHAGTITQPPSQSAGTASLFVMVPAPGTSPVHTGNLTAFTRLAPDLPAYVICDTNGLNWVSFTSTVKRPIQEGDLTPAKLIMLRHGDNTTMISASQDNLVILPSSHPSDWQVWIPASGQFENMAEPTTCHDPVYLTGLSLWSRHRALAWTPAKVDAALPELIKDTRAANLLIPEAAFIVLETQSQEVMLARKERQSLTANHALEFDENTSEKAPAPPVAWLILPVLGFLWKWKEKA